MNPGRQLLTEMLLTGLLPLLHGAQGLDRLPPDMELLQRLVAPLNHHLFGLGLIGLLHQQLHKFRLIQLGIDHDLLPLLDIDTPANDQAGIFTQYGFFHNNRLLCFLGFPLW